MVPVAGVADAAEETTEAARGCGHADGVGVPKDFDAVVCLPIGASCGPPLQDRESVDGIGSALGKWSSGMCGQTKPARLGRQRLDVRDQPILERAILDDDVDRTRPTPCMLKRLVDRRGEFSRALGALCSIKQEDDDLGVPQEQPPHLFVGGIGDCLERRVWMHFCTNRPEEGVAGGRFERGEEFGEGVNFGLPFGDDANPHRLIRGTLSRTHPLSRRPERSLKPCSQSLGASGSRSAKGLR